jgi:hypothetical protein
VPHIHARGNFLRDWRLLGGTHQGKHHQDRGLMCEDAFEFGSDNELIWLAVADGLGGELRSEHGARYVVRAVDNFIRESVAGSRDAKSNVRTLFEHCRRGLLKEAQTLDCDPREFSTTLQVALLSTREDMFYYGVIGDGHCIATLSSEECLVLGDERKRPRMGTAHILHEHAHEYLHIEALPLHSLNGVFVFSDGLDDLLLDQRRWRNAGKRAKCHDVLALRDAIAASQDESRGVLIVNTLVAANQHESLTDDKTLAMAIRSTKHPPPNTENPPGLASACRQSREHSRPDSFEDEFPLAGRSPLTHTERASLTGPSNLFPTDPPGAPDTAKGRIVQKFVIRFHKRAISDWLPWVQTILLLIVALMIADHLGFRSFIGDNWQSLSEILH